MNPRTEIRYLEKSEFRRLAGISTRHLQNLHRSQRYRRRLLHFEKTQPAAIATGEHKKPDTLGQSGFLAAATVHQGNGADLPRGTATMGDTEAARRMQQARRRRFEGIPRPSAWGARGQCSSSPK